MAIAKAGTDTQGNGDGDNPVSWSHTLVAGSNRLVVVLVGVEDDSAIDITGITYGGNAMTKAIDGLTGVSGYRVMADIWYILEGALPGDGAKTVTVTFNPFAGPNQECTCFCAEYTGVKQQAPEATDETAEAAPGDDTIENTISPSNNAWVMSVAACGLTGTNWTHGQGQVEVLDYQDSSSRVAVAELRGASGEISLSSTFFTNANRMVRCAASFLEYTAVAGIPVHMDNYHRRRVVQG